MKTTINLSTNINSWRNKTKIILKSIKTYNDDLPTSSDYLDYEARGYSSKSKLGFINYNIDTAWNQLANALVNLDKALAQALIEEIDKK